MTCWFRVARSVERKMVMFSFQPKIEKKRSRVVTVFSFILSMVFIMVEVVVGEGDAWLLV